MKRIENQHGDVLLERVKSIPNGAVRVNAKSGFIVERGEGVHTHVLHKKLSCAVQEIPLELVDIQDDVEVWTINDDMYIKVKKDREVILDHEEHGKQILKEGIYRKHIEREYDYEANEERRVID